jgi:uncharacterized membrane protein
MTTVHTERVRIESVDLVRGIIMIVMALDHTRDFFGVPGDSPTDLSKASAALFFTRWITDICAPVFFLLTGTGSSLSLRRRSRSELSRFLFRRGLWLIFLEGVILRCLVMQFNFDYHVTPLVVIWALGWAMITLSVLTYLPKSVIAAFGLIVIAVHNLFDPIQAASFGAFAPLWNILHVPGFLINNPQHQVFVVYPLIPWIGVTAVGYALGQIYNWPAERRRAWLLRLGIGTSTGFLLLRTINIYGDPVRWTLQKSPLFTALSFLNTNKYPPSLLFLLMTLGPALLMLWAFDGRTPQLLRPALIFGKVPLFFYAIHFLLIHLLAVALCFARYGQVHWMFESNDMSQYPQTSPPGWGFGLPVTYLIWILVVAALYPLSLWFARLKQRRSDRWLSYF